MFYDEFALQFYDDDSFEEDRFFLLGMSDESRILVSVHCERGSEREKLRIISAMKVTNSERQYLQGDAQ